MLLFRTIFDTCMYVLFDTSPNDFDQVEIEL